jgi:RNA polymerase sigma-70 factor (ECF subfamily)
MLRCGAKAGPKIGADKLTVGTQHFRRVRGIIREARLRSLDIEPRVNDLPGTNEARLIALAQSGDREAFSQLYERHVQAIYRYVRLKVNDDHTAEDVTADVFVRALEGIAKFDYRGIPLSAWLYRIARDRVVDHYRAQSRHQSSELTESLACPEQGPHDTVVGDMDRERLSACLDRLSEEQRQVVILRFLEHKRAEDIARMLGKTAVAIRSLQHRALASLGRMMAEERP